MSELQEELLMRETVAELRRKLEDLNRENLSQADLIVSLQTENQRWKDEVAWLKSRWPEKPIVTQPPDHEKLLIVDDTVPEPPSSICFPVVMVAVLFVLAFAAVWYVHRVPQMKPTAEVPSPNLPSTVPVNDPDSYTIAGYFAVKLIPQQKCWVAVTADGVLHAGIMSHGDPIMFTAKDTISVRDGCPGQIVFMRDGKVVDPAPETGHKSTVEVVHFSRSENAESR